MCIGILLRSLAKRSSRESVVHQFCLPWKKKEKIKKGKALEEVPVIQCPFHFCVLTGFIVVLDRDLSLELYWNVFCRVVPDRRGRGGWVECVSDAPAPLGGNGISSLPSPLLPQRLWHGWIAPQPLEEAFFMSFPLKTQLLWIWAAPIRASKW